MNPKTFVIFIFIIKSQSDLSDVRACLQDNY